MLEWIMGVLFSTVIAAICFLPTKSGYALREGIVTRRFFKVLLPILGWSVFYFIMFQILPLDNFLFSLLLLGLPVLGFFGYVITPSFDIFD